MTDLALLPQALLAAVPAEGSIGNQSLFEKLRDQFSELTEEQFWAERDALIEQGVLVKDRGRGGSVLRAQVAGVSLAEQTLNKVRQRFEATVVAEVLGEHIVEAAAVVKKGKAAKVQPATSIEAMEKTLWAMADKLRANMDAAEYKHIVLGLIFLKYISDSFAGRRAELEAKFANENDDYYLGDGDPELFAAELEDRDYYREVNVFWVPEVARWESIRAAAKQVDIGKRIDEALAAIEAENPKLKNILDKRYARAQLPDGKLGELVDLISTIGFGDDANKARDLLGHVYEYFLGQFASAEGKKGGQFYTPASIVKTLVAVLNPHHGKVYDPCCGSGGMFVQSEKFIEAHGGKLGDVSIYGQESNPTTWRLAAMNLAIRGIDFNLGKEPADMSSEWPVVPVEDVCELIVDCVNKTAPVVSYETPFRMIRTTNIRDGRVSLDSCRFVDGATYEKWTRRAKLQYGDVLLTREAPIGEVGFVDLPEGLFLGQRIMQYRANSKVLHPRFLHYVFQSPSLKHQFGSHEGSGSVVSHIRVGDCFKFKIPLPPIDVQDGVAELLGALDDRITLLRDTNATLEAIAQALFKSWFVDFDPVRAKAEGRQPEGMDATTAALFPDSFEESELGLVPKEWKVERAEQWLSVLETGRRPKGGVSGILDGVPSIGAESIVRIGEFDYSKTKYVPAEFFEKMKSGALQSHDVLLYKDGGKPGVFLPRVSMFGDGFPFQICGINEHVFRVRLKEPFGQAFLYYWLWSDQVMHELKHRGGKAAIPGINQSDVKELKLLVPNEQALRRFDEITSPWVNRIFANAKKARTLTQLRDTLLPRLISGQLCLPGAESLLEKAL